MIKEVDKTINFVDIVSEKYKEFSYIDLTYSDSMKVYNCSINPDIPDTLICHKDFMDLFDIDEYIDTENNYYRISIENHLF